MHWYKRDPDAALVGMAELTLEERGAYNSILDLLYSRDGDVPDDDHRVARMIRVHWRSWAAMKKRLIELGKVRVEGGKITARRVQETLKDASELSEKQRRNASRRWHERKKLSEINESGMPAGNASTSTPTTTTTEENSISDEKVDLPKAKKLASRTSPAFETFWAEYPAREGGNPKFPAYKIFFRFTDSGVDPQAIIHGAKNYAAMLRSTGKYGTQYVKQASTWLNARQWEDFQKRPEPQLQMLVRPL